LLLFIEIEDGYVGDKVQYNVYKLKNALRLRKNTYKSVLSGMYG